MGRLLGTSRALPNLDSLDMPATNAEPTLYQLSTFHVPALRLPSPDPEATSSNRLSQNPPYTLNPIGTNASVTSALNTQKVKPCFVGFSSRPLKGNLFRIIRVPISLLFRISQYGSPAAQASAPAPGLRLLRLARTWKASSPSQCLIYCVQEALWSLFQQSYVASTWGYLQGTGASCFAIVGLSYALLLFQ